ncbi:phosphoenolpyruvate synthase regulatory protein [Sporosarcina sp. P18a]|uniref:pyruvate, water dikinase regulatory protein n=1 Tax=unclassified Sporosarcina TaxID=2647733 RepID=UPI000C169598|nr:MULTISPECIES: pyruvate, water dikinase regulatory protein [unclassified Sporosarcina]PIC72084.1 phosphoenolpyruvate synthase regulatory protein [Sporosarcina sp. P16b]PIC81113.1 phosphoenolpyruvate synthase regulatory protein [Sporosarcina sp. P18a]PID03686.1 phosphoenolpyruvate synthase regulatory protein [Sporosarcina sp. P2]PID23799.1 phosphoenolpyruvate synthase regulatory protein [Sporosarcina sp. P7]
MTKFTLFIVSDSVGETAGLVTKAAASQFRHDLETVSIKRFSYIEENSQLEEIVFLAKQQQALIVFTLVKSQMREQLYVLCEELEVPFVDLLGPLIEKMGDQLKQEPFEEPGLVRKLDDDYFKKIEAIEFAVRYDDGRDTRGILEADMVLIGVSRTSKTPLSQYLANKGFKVANVPLMPEVDPPSELFSIDPTKCFGLCISVEQLNSIRKSRLEALGLKDDANYAKIARIQQEMDYFNEITTRVGCEVIDVTNRAVEETANTILKAFSARKAN